VGKYVLGNYTDYYGIPFPLSKLDLIAIPDYSAGAMEVPTRLSFRTRCVGCGWWGVLWWANRNARAQNWGLITFRQTALLYDPQQSSTSDKQRVAVVIAHELAHQWFGNLVTMKVS
jgi:aminopeptidase N